MIVEKRDYPNCITYLIQLHFNNKEKNPIKIFYCSNKAEVDTHAKMFDMSTNTVKDKLPSNKFVKFYYVAYGPMTMYKVNKQKQMEFTATKEYRIYYTEIR